MVNEKHAIASFLAGAMRAFVLADLGEDFTIEVRQLHHPFRLVVINLRQYVRSESGLCRGVSHRTSHEMISASVIPFEIGADVVEQMLHALHYPPSTAAAAR